MRKSVFRAPLLAASFGILAFAAQHTQRSQSRGFIKPAFQDGVGAQAADGDAHREGVVGAGRLLDQKHQRLTGARALLLPFAAVYFAARVVMAMTEHAWRSSRPPRL